MNLSLCRFMPLGGQGPTVDFLFNAPQAAKKLFDAAAKARTGWNTEKQGGFLAFSGTDDFGNHQNFNVLAYTIVCTDVDTSHLIQKTLTLSNEEAAIKHGTGQKAGFM